MNAITKHFDLSPLDRADLAPGTLRHYKAAILLMLAANVNPQDHEQLAEYASTLPASGKANLKAAIGILTRDMVNKAKMSNAPVETIQRFLWMLEAINNTITVKQTSAERTPHWLSQKQVDTLLELSTGRDNIVLSVLLGAGLRREELEKLTFEALSQIPYNGTMKDVLTVTGKGDKKRVVPISQTLADKLRSWKRETKGGRIARRLSKAGKIGKSLSAYGIFTIVRKYGLLLGIDNLDPHDLRRTYGRLMYEATGDIVLVQNLLGHSDPRTTLKYIGYTLNLDVDTFPI